MAGGNNILPRLSQVDIGRGIMGNLSENNTNPTVTLTINHVLFCRLTGGTSPRSLPLIPSTVQPQRTGIRGHVHTHRNAGDTGMRGPGCHKCLYHNPLDGHASGAYRQEVSITRVPELYFSFFLLLYFREGNRHREWLLRDLYTEHNEMSSEPQEECSTSLGSVCLCKWYRFKTI